MNQMNSSHYVQTKVNNRNHSYVHQTKEQLTVLLYTNIGRSLILCHTTLALKMSNELSGTNTLTANRL